MWAPFCDTYAPNAEKDSSISAKERQQILQSAIDTYGPEHQVDMAIEEMADVQITLDQLKLIYGWDREVETDKLVRLQRRITDAQKG